MIKEDKSAPVMVSTRIPASTLASIREAEDKLRKEEGKVKTYVVGGHHPLIRDTWLPQMSEQIGLTFIMVGHKLPSRKATGFVPDNSEFIFLMKDMASHALRGWAKKESQRLNIPMIETTQKVLNAVEDFKSWSFRMYEIGQDLKLARAKKLQEQKDAGVTMEETTDKSKSPYLYYDTFKSLVDSDLYGYFPFHSSDEKENKDYWFERIKEKLGENHTYYLDELIEYMDTYLKDLRKKCSLQLKSKWVYAFFDDKHIDPEHTKNQSRVNNSFKSLFNSRLPDELRKEVSELLHLLHGEDTPSVLVSNTTEIETAPTIETPTIETPKVEAPIEEAPKPVEEAPKPIEEAPKPIETPKLVEAPKPTIQGSEERTVSFTDLSLTLKKGSQILLKQVKANKLDLTQSQDLDISIDKVEDGILYNVLIKY